MDRLNPTKGAIGKLEQAIIDIISGVLDCPVDNNTSMGNAPQWDSLKTLQIVMALEEKGYSIPFEKLTDVNSVKDIADILRL